MRHADAKGAGEKHVAAIGAQVAQFVHARFVRCFQIQFSLSGKRVTPAAVVGLRWIGGPGDDDAFVDLVGAAPGHAEAFARWPRTHRIETVGRGHHLDRLPRFNAAIGGHQDQVVLARILRCDKAERVVADATATADHAECGADIRPVIAPQSEAGVIGFACRATIGDAVGVAGFGLVADVEEGFRFGRGRDIKLFDADQCVAKFAAALRGEQQAAGLVGDATHGADLFIGQAEADHMRADRHALCC